VIIIIVVTRDSSQLIGLNKPAHKDNNIWFSRPFVTMEAPSFEGGCGRC
jgi:hypothetical protein